MYIHIYILCNIYTYIYYHKNEHIVLLNLSKNNQKGYTVAFLCAFFPGLHHSLFFCLCSSYNHWLIPNLSSFVSQFSLCFFTGLSLTYDQPPELSCKYSILSSDLSLSIASKRSPLPLQLHTRKSSQGFSYVRESASSKLLLFSSVPLLQEGVRLGGAGSFVTGTKPRVAGEGDTRPALSTAPGLPPIARGRVSADDIWSKYTPRQNNVLLFVCVCAYVRACVCVSVRVRVRVCVCVCVSLGTRVCW